MLPDLLNNNCLEDPALSLVKSAKNISEIWDRPKINAQEKTWRNQQIYGAVENQRTRKTHGRFQ